MSADGQGFYPAVCLADPEILDVFDYVGIPAGDPPAGGFPGVVCLHGTTNWGARRTLGLPPEPGDPHKDKGGVEGKDYARQLVRRGYVTISPEHFCCASRTPEEGPYETAAFYRRHPDWSAVGKYVYDSVIATDILADRSDVNANRLGVTGHSLGATEPSSLPPTMIESSVPFQAVAEVPSEKTRSRSIGREITGISTSRSFVSSSWLVRQLNATSTKCSP